MCVYENVVALASQSSVSVCARAGVVLPSHAAAAAAAAGVVVAVVAHENYHRNYQQTTAHVGLDA